MTPTQALTRIAAIEIERGMDADEAVERGMSAVHFARSALAALAAPVGEDKPMEPVAWCHRLASGELRNPSMSERSAEWFAANGEGVTVVPLYTAPTAVQAEPPPIDNRFVAPGCEKFPVLSAPDHLHTLASDALADHLTAGQVPTPENQQRAVESEGRLFNAIEAIATPPAQAEPSDMVLVPREPTDAMLRACNNGPGQMVLTNREIWRAMTAAPQT